MYIFPANPTTITTICRDGIAKAYRIEHPALEGSLCVNFDKPGCLSPDHLRLFRAGMDLTKATLANDIIAALSVMPGVSLDDAESLADIWEAESYGEGSHLAVGPIRNA